MRQSTRRASLWTAAGAAIFGVSRLNPVRTESLTIDDPASERAPRSGATLGPQGGAAESRGKPGDLARPRKVKAPK